MRLRPDAAVDPADRATARLGLLLFFALAAVFDAVIVTVIAITGQVLWIFALMWSVAAASVICRIVLKEGLRDVSFRFGGRRSLLYVVAGVLLPVVIGFVAFGTAWMTGLATFVGPAGAFLTTVLVAATVGTVGGAVSAAGEEIGWRGYMLTRLIDAGVPAPVIVSGLIWGAWHVPLIVTGIIYGASPSTALAVVVFMVSATSAGVIIARFRLDTGSIWPPIAFHAAYNSVIQTAFTPATAGPDAPLWVGEEAGILVAVTLVVAAVLFSLGPSRRLRWPDAAVVDASS
jgi:membrane protease YdiL (CAAX protease family)